MNPELRWFVYEAPVLHNILCIASLSKQIKGPNSFSSKNKTTTKNLMLFFFFLKKSAFILPCHALKKCPTYSCITGLTLTWTASHSFDEKYLPGRKAEAFCHLPNNWSSRGLKHLPHQPEDWWTVNSRYQIAWSYAGSARQQPEILSSKFVWGNP